MLHLQVRDHRPARTRRCAASSASSPVPVEGTVVDVDGGTIGGLLLCVADGRLSGLEVYSLVDGPLPMPLREHVRW